MEDTEAVRLENEENGENIIQLLSNKNIGMMRRAIDYATKQYLLNPSKLDVVTQRITDLTNDLQSSIREHEVVVLVLSKKPVQDTYFVELFNRTDAALANSLREAVRDNKLPTKEEFGLKWANELASVISEILSANNGVAKKGRIAKDYSVLLEKKSENTDAFYRSQILLQLAKDIANQNTRRNPSTLFSTMEPLNPLLELIIGGFNETYVSAGKSCYARMFRYTTNDIALSRQFFEWYFLLLGRDKKNSFKMVEFMRTTEFDPNGEKLELFKVSDLLMDENFVKAVPFVYPLIGCNKRGFDTYIRQIIDNADWASEAKNCEWFVPLDPDSTETDLCKAIS